MMGDDTKITNRKCIIVSLLWEHNLRSGRLEAGVENNAWQEQKLYVASDDPRVSEYSDITQGQQ